MYRTFVFALLFVGGWLFAQANQGKSDPPQDQNGKVTVKGCVSRLSGHFVLMQSDPSNSYALEASSKINIGHYLGQQVQVTGTESHTSPTSSHSIREPVGGPPATIIVESISAISKQCSH